MKRHREEGAKKSLREEKIGGEKTEEVGRCRWKGRKNRWEKGERK